MSWSPRDYPGRTQQADPHAPPQQAVSDDEPLPTYMAGLEDYDEDITGDGVLPSWHLRHLQIQGLWTQGQLTTWANFLRRGVCEE